MRRVYARKVFDTDNPFMYIELDDGSFVSLGGRSHGRVRSKEWSEETFAAVDAGTYPGWERVA
jgi:hypothetical protein